MNQKEAVFEAIKQLKPSEVEKEEPVMLTKQEKKVVEQRLFDGFRKGKIQYNGEKPSDDKMSMYISGLVSNWLRKDKRLNGNKNYVPRRPGSRVGFSTPVAMQPTAVNPEQLRAIQALAGADGGEVQVFVVRSPPRPQQQQEEADSSMEEQTAET